MLPQSGYTFFAKGRQKKLLFVKYCRSTSTDLACMLILSSFAPAKAAGAALPLMQKLGGKLKKKCKEDTHSWVSTLIDLYGSPRDLPGKVETETIVDPLQKVLQIEQAFEQNIKQENSVQAALATSFAVTAIFEQSFGVPFCRAKQ